MISRRDFLKAGAIGAAGAMVPAGVREAFAACSMPPGVSNTPVDLLGVLTSNRYRDALPIPPVAKPYAKDTTYEYYTLTMAQSTTVFHSLMKPTITWGYGASYLGPTFVVKQGQKIKVTFKNNLPWKHALPIDTTILMGVPMQYQYVPRTSVHVHGGLQPQRYDGDPDLWFVPGQSFTSVFENDQPPATLWYHDHGIGITRLNVHMGLAAGYLIVDPAREKKLGLPSGEFEIPLIVQDRSFKPGSTSDYTTFSYPCTGITPEHPVWVPEFFGDVATINGRAWPRLDVKRGKYRFRVFNGSNARFYNFALYRKSAFDSMRLQYDQTQDIGVFAGMNPVSPSAPPDLPRLPDLKILQVGTDGGYLPAPVELDSLFLAPGERADIVIDFGSLAAGEQVVLFNNASVPYPGGDLDPNMTEIMLFRALPEVTNIQPNYSYLPSLAPLPPAPGMTVRRIKLEERADANDNPLAVLLEGLHWDAPATIKVPLGATEIWEFHNFTGDAHPMHVHLIQFQPLDRLDAITDEAGNLVPGSDGYLQPKPGARYLPDANEQGWKDTFKTLPGQITRVIAKWPSDPKYKGKFPFHCHILDHEDNDMMRPYLVVDPLP